MVGHDPHDVADDRSRIAAGEIEKAVLFRKARDLGFGVLQDQSVAIEPAAGVGSPINVIFELVVKLASTRLPE